MISTSNTYLFSVGIAIASIGILGFMVFFNNRKSITNQTFLMFSLVSIAWNTFNYLVGESLPHEFAIWILRGLVFFAVWYCFFIFQLLYVFPQESFSFSKNYKRILVPIVIGTSLITLTPFVFARIAAYLPNGDIGAVENGYGIFVFGIVVVSLIIGALRSLTKKLIGTSGEAKKPIIFVLVGTFLTFALYVTFNFIFPAFLNNPTFIQLGAVFTLPFVAFTAYAIIKHHLLNVKVFAAQALTFILAVTTFAQVFIVKGFMETVFQVLVFLLVLVFGILLIKSVLREVEQREELARLDKILEEKNAKLEELSRFKTELLSLASHQIRSPLAAVKGFASLILEGSYGPAPDKIKETVEKMKKSTEELIGLINTLLDVRKVEEGKMEYQFARADITKIVSDVVGLLQSLAETKKLEFKFDSPGREVFVSADGEKLKQVVQNLVDNAIKYTPSGFVHVALKVEPAAGASSAGSGPAGTVTVSVADSGVGFSADLAPHLFEEFVRDERVKKQILGTGLGLYIAREIAEAHGGKIRAESAGEGKGSTFSLSVPEVK